jgi:cytochrome c-type biogenesis protein CcmH
VRRETLRNKSSWFFGAALVAPFLAAALLFAAEPSDLEEQTRAIAAELRCPVCQNLSVADSPSELAQQMRALAKEQLQQGKSPEEVKAFFVSKYGDWVLLAPPAKGFSLLLWVLPYVAALLGFALVVVAMRRWVKKTHATAPAETRQESVRSTNGGESRRVFLGDEQVRLHAEIKEIEFDFQSGKLSEADYGALRRDLETQAAAAAKQLESLPPEPRARSSADRTPAREKKIFPSQARSLRNWQLAAGALFLLLLGLTLGVLLTKSMRPRASEQETMTGDFLTGTQPAGGADALLAQGRAAFEKRNFSQAIDLFKKVLAADPNQPEAHAYMGLILAQAGHNEGALMAFDRALAGDPNFPVALWGKGMLLSQTKGDPAEARRLLQKVLGMMPPGPEKDKAEKIIAQLGQGENPKKTAASAPNQSAPTIAKKAEPATTQTAGAEIQGVIDIDAKLKGNVDSAGVLFIIAKSTPGAAGPPLAVKRISNPKFPLAYSVSAENVMMPGTPFTGKLFLSARLDKDGNPATKEPGDLAGEYKKNPVEVGAKKIDIVLEAAR